jgi:acetyltransferase-like isoleucine patch superfamily enzyme
VKNTSATHRARGLYERLVARRWLRACDRVGARPVLRARPLVVNEGELSLGDDFELSSSPVRSHLFVAGGGRLRIGHRVRIGTGAAISCQRSIDVEDDVTIGGFSSILDSDFHVAEDRSVAAEGRPIQIGRGARIGHRVIVLPGSSIGAGAQVRAGSVVSGEVPAYTVVGGNPARAHPASPVAIHGLRRPIDVVPGLVMRVLGLSGLPDLDSGPAQIAEWDSLGALRLILALEESFSITLPEDDLRAAQSIRELVGRVEAAQRRQASPDASTTA